MAERRCRGRAQKDYTQLESIPVLSSDRPRPSWLVRIVPVQAKLPAGISPRPRRDRVYNSSNLTFAASIAITRCRSSRSKLLLTVLGRLEVGVNNETLVQLVTARLPSHFDFVLTRLRADQGEAGPGVVGPSSSSGRRWGFWRDHVRRRSRLGRREAARLFHAQAHRGDRCWFRRS